MEDKLVYGNSMTKMEMRFTMNFLMRELELSVEMDLEVMQLEEAPAPGTVVLLNGCTKTKKGKLEVPASTYQLKKELVT